MPFVCDLCGGAPKCEEWCPANAIQYVPTIWANLMKKRELSAALFSFVKEARKFNMTKYDMKE
jgi:Fe-S-cluster-containing hydrogenase component 2